MPRTPMARDWRAAVLAAALAVLLAMALPALGEPIVHVDDYPYGFQGEGDERVRDLDARVGAVAATPEQVAAARALGASVRWNAFGTPHVLVRHGGVLTAPREGDHVDVARAFVAEHRALFRLSEAAVGALEVLRVSPLYDAPDLGRVARGLEPGNPDVATVVLLRQTFGDLAAALDGLLTVGVTADGAVAWVSSSVTGEERVSGARRLSPATAWRIAAGDVGRGVDADAVAVAEQADAHGFTRLAVEGWREPQRVRLGAVPTPAGGVRVAYETVVLDPAPALGQPLAFIHFVDAETGEVLYRTNRVDHFASGGGALAQVAPPSGSPFQGSTALGACGPVEGPFTVAEGTGSIQVAVAALPNAALDDDITLELVFGGQVVASQDLLTSPEVLLYSPPGGVPAGDYGVRVCPFNAGAAPISYGGLFTTSPLSGGGGGGSGEDTGPFGEPRWRVFPANPQFAQPGGEPVGDDREVWCWFPGDDCDRIVGMDPRPGATQYENLASRAPWDVNPRENLPSFTTDGNNASTAISELSFLTPDTVVRRPVALDRDYDFEWTNAWFASNCDPTNFQRADRNRNDEDAATVNLFTMHNRMHDWGYHLGWTENNSTLQKSNFGNTGPNRENDPELGQSQAGRTSPLFTGRDNANQITLQDGIPGITNQYLWQPLQAGFYAPCVDGAYDMAVVAHEVGHAIQNRMTAGPNGQLSGDQARSMGESWSDLTAIEYLNGYGFVPVGDENVFSVGAYVTGDGNAGIRNYNMSLSTLNLSNIEYDGNGTTSPHADGEIWSAVNFDIRQRLIADHDARYPASDLDLQVRCADGELPADRCPGNRRWIQIMHDAFLLQPSATSMLDSRDAQLAADVLRFGGENQSSLWDAYAVRGMGTDASSEGTADRDPIPGFTSPERDDEATVRFRPVAVDGGGVPATANVYVGTYEARSTPVATSEGGAPTDARQFVPGTYQFIVTAPGYGGHRFTRTLAPGEDLTLDVPLRRNLASRSHGSTATGDGGNLAELIDDTEATNWGSVGEGDVRGKQVTVALGGGRTRISEVQVSAALRPARGEDPAEPEPGEDPSEEPDDQPPYDTGGQNRFSALRQFEILACDATTGVACDADAHFRSIFTSPEDAFPSIRPRPRVPELTLRPFAVPPTDATHVRIRVLHNQCTGNPLYQGDANPDDDPINDPDCVNGRAAAGATGGTISLSQVQNVRIAELQVFGQPQPLPDGATPGDPNKPAEGTVPPGSAETVPPVGGAPGTVAFERVRGAGRIETAVALSQRAHSAADAAVLARADQFPDALAAAPLAAEVRGPVLLTPSNALAPAVGAELERLGVETVYLAGGTAAVSEGVAAQLRADGYEVVRLSGGNRFGTAVAIAEEIVEIGGRVNRLVLARADAFPDALAASNVAIAGRAPILLTTGDRLEPTTAAALRDLLQRGRRVTVAGGTAALSDRVVSDVRQRGYDAQRTFGRNRYETAVALAEEARSLGAPAGVAVLASGLAFPDALAAGPAAARLGGVLLLVDPADLARSGATRAWLQANARTVQRIVVAGGTSAVSEAVAEAAVAAASSAQ
jgi:extracellular elastinolytic metalloproteinase